MFRVLCLIPLPGWLLIVAPGDARADAMVTVLQEISALWREHGLSPVRIEPLLTVEARAHAWDMSRHDYFAHVALEGGMVGQRASQAGYRWRLVLENLAAGQTTPKEAVEGWKGSAGHRKAMLDPNIRELGVGYAYLPGDNGRIKAFHYWAMSMGRR